MIHSRNIFFFRKPQRMSSNLDANDTDHIKDDTPKCYYYYYYGFARPAATARSSSGCLDLGPVCRIAHNTQMKRRFPALEMSSVGRNYLRSTTHTPVYTVWAVIFQYMTEVGQKTRQNINGIAPCYNAVIILVALSRISAKPKRIHFLELWMMVWSDNVSTIIGCKCNLL